MPTLDLFTQVFFLEDDYTQEVRKFLMHRKIPQNLIDKYWPNQEYVFYTDSNISSSTQNNHHTDISQYAVETIQRIYAEDFKFIENAKHYKKWRKKCHPSLY